MADGPSDPHTADPDETGEFSAPTPRAAPPPTPAPPKTPAAHTEPSRPEAPPPQPPQPKPPADTKSDSSRAGSSGRYASRELSRSEEEAETFIGHAPAKPARPAPLGPRPTTPDPSGTRPGEPGAWGASIVSGPASEPRAFPSAPPKPPPRQPPNSVQPTAGASVADSWDKPAVAGGAPTVISRAPAPSVPHDPDPEIIRDGFIGPYKVLERVGRGGMGVVYRARDERLARDVAIKVLPDAFAEHRDRIARFDREARLLASFTHKNIAQIYELGDQGGLRYIVMEYVPGDTLAKRLQGGPLPLEDVLAINIQIAEGLEEAHERGIIHRDLKPGNVKITPDGTVKVLDFGLAKAQGAEPDRIEATAAPTGSLENTQAGVILGTAGYMSPEQARGQPTDRRTDVWSFGCVLYESLTAHTPFEGATFTDTISRILQGEPDWGRLPDGTPRRVLEVLQRCLRKQSRRRLRDLGDARLELEDLLERVHSGAMIDDEAVVIREAAPTTTKTPWMSWIVAMAAVGVAATVTALLFTKPRARPQRILHVAETLPGEVSLALSGGPALAVSPDGQRIAYLAQERGERQPSLLVRSFDSSRPARPASRVAQATAPFFSPDGRSLGFIAAGQVYVKSPIEGDGDAQLIETSGGLRAFAAAWVAPDTIVCSDAEGRTLKRVQPQGGQVTQIAEAPSGVRYLAPTAIPGDSRRMLITVESAAGSRLAIMPIAGGPPVEIVSAQRGAIIDIPGTDQVALLYVTDDTLWWRPLARKTLRPETNATAQSLPNDYRPAVGPAGPHVAWGASGAMVYVPGQGASLRLARLGADSAADSRGATLAEGQGLRSPRIEPGADAPRVACIAGEGDAASVRVFTNAGLQSEHDDFDGDIAAIAWRPGRNTPALSAIERSSIGGRPSATIVPDILASRAGAGGTIPHAVTDARWDAAGEKLYLAAEAEGGEVRLYQYTDAVGAARVEEAVGRLHPTAPVQFAAGGLLAYVALGDNATPGVRIVAAGGGSFGPFPGDSPAWAPADDGSLALWYRSSRKLARRTLDPAASQFSAQQDVEPFKLSLQPGNAFDIDPTGRWIAYLASEGDDGVLRVVFGLDRLLQQQMASGGGRR